MVFKTLFALTFAVGTIGIVSANAPVSFRLNEPVSIAGVPPVTLAPGCYVLRKLNSPSGANVVQVLSKRQDYVFTTVVTIPAVRLHPDDTREFLFSETPSGHPPALHYWFPPGETLGHEFVNPLAIPSSEPDAAPKLVYRNEAGRSAQFAGSPADLYALREAVLRIESGKFGSARDYFRRNYFLERNREGAFTSFLLALLMVDPTEARSSLDLVRRLDPERTRTLSRLDVNGVVESLTAGRSNLKTSRVRRFLLDLAMERTDDPITRTAVVSFERHVLKGDSYHVELALDRRSDEREKQRKREERWVLTSEKIAKLNECVLSLLNRIGALQYSAAKGTAAGRLGPVMFTVVLDQRRLDNLDAIVGSTNRTIRERRSRLERLISQRNAAMARELDSLRSSLRELDRQPGSTTNTQFTSLRKWDSASPASVSRDLMNLGETATQPYMRPSNVVRTNQGYVQINIAGSLARLAELAEL
jgi:hypothetical protein